MENLVELVELKYCERCGTLGMRRRSTERIYCEPCREEMSEVYLAPSQRRPEKALAGGLA
jgi:hypothetical protein